MRPIDADELIKSIKTTAERAEDDRGYGSCVFTVEQIEGMIADCTPVEQQERISVKDRLKAFMRGLWEEICIGEVTYTTKEVYNMINKEVFGIEESVFINRPQFKAEDKKAIKAKEPVQAYKCDPKKNTECKKTGCFERGGPCELTLNPKYAKEG